MKGKPVSPSHLPPSAFQSPPHRTERIPKDFGLERSSSRLPIASTKTVNGEMVALIRKHLKGFLLVALLQLVTVCSALVTPRVFGRRDERIQRRNRARKSTIQPDTFF